MTAFGALRLVGQLAMAAPRAGAPPRSRDPSLLVEIEGKFQVGSLCFGIIPQTLLTVSSTNPLYIHFGGIGVGRVGRAPKIHARVSFAFVRAAILATILYCSHINRPLAFGVPHHSSGF